MSLVLRQLRCLLLVIAASLGLSAAEGTGTGLLATYYANETLSGSPAVSRTDAQVNFAWSGGAPASGMPVDSFSARWDGEIEALYSEPLTLIARTDDGVRLWINGSLVIDAWVLRSASDSAYTFSAVAGQRYQIRMEYYEHFGSAVAQLEWQSGTLARAAIPTAQLYPVAPAEAPVGSGSGLLARYYANETLSNAPVVSRTDATVDFNWGGTTPDAAVPVNGFSARWDGEIEARYSEPLTITARTDDGVRVWLDGILVVDAWVLRSAANSSFTISAEAGQRYRIRMEYFEHTGDAVARLWWQSASEFQGPIPTSQLYPTPANDPPVGTGTGLLARFYANETLSGAPMLTRTDARVDFDWAGGSPGSSVPADVFSARWDGEIEARATEALTLILRTDDGVRLWLDDQLVINAWVLRGATDSTYTFNAQAGQRYRIRIDYFEHHGSAVAKLWWQSPSEPKGPVPTSQLYPTAPVEPPLGTGTGLAGSYFTNETLTGTPALVRLDPVVDFDWAGGSPASSIPTDSFSIRWEGEFEPRYTEDLTIIARTDDGVRVWIDDQPVITAWILRGATDSTYTFSAQAGQRYRIRMEYYEHFGSAVAKLWWQSAHELRSPIPTTQLYPAAIVETPVLGFATAASAVSEKSGSTTIAVTLSPASTTIVTAALSPIGSGIQIPASLTIPAGETTANIPVTIQDDQRYGPDRLVTIALSNPAGAVLGQTTHVLTLQNTEPKPTIGFTTDNSFNLEQSGTASVVVRLSAVSAVPTTVSVVTSGTATSGTDYTAPAATLQIPADTFEGTIFIPLLTDAEPEANETIVLTLANPVDATLGGITAHTLTLSDGNLAPVIVSGPTPAANPVTGSSVELTLVANDDGAPAALTTTWSVVGTPPATVTFTPSSSVGFSAATVATFAAPGSYTIQAQVRDAYNATDTEQVIVTVVAPRQPQSITFAAPPAKTYGDAAFTLTATASSGLPVTLTSADPTIATISGSTVTIVGAGSTTITAAQAGDAAWEPATPVTHPLSVAKASQTITFTALTSRVVGDAPFTLTASASSGQPVSYISSNTSVATVSGSTVTILAAGTTTITASQAGTANYLAAASVDQVLTVTKQTQTITFAALAGKTYGDAAFTLSATASSGLPVTYTSTDPAVATVNGNTVTIVGAGSTTISASQAGDATWEAAPTVEQPLIVAKAAQTITFAALTARAVGDAPFTLGATASSGLAITYTSSDTNVATVSSNTVTIVGVGTTTITAEQGGNANYHVAPSVPQVQTITTPSKQSQTITFVALPTKTVGEAPFALTAIASSGLPVSYTSSDTTVATVSGTTVTILAAGTTTITATQSGDDTYEAAPAIEQELTVVGRPAPVVSYVKSTISKATFLGTYPTNIGITGIDVTIVAPSTVISFTGDVNGGVFQVEVDNATPAVTQVTVALAFRFGTDVGPQTQRTVPFGASGGGGGDYEDGSPEGIPPFPPTVTLVIESGLTGKQLETIDEKELHFTQNNSVTVRVHTSGSYSPISSVIVTSSDGQSVPAVNGVATLPTPTEGAWELSATAVATNDWGTALGSTEESTHLIVDRTEPRLLHVLPSRYWPPGMTQPADAPPPTVPLRHGVDDERLLVRLNGNDTGINTTLRNEQWLNVFDHAGYTGEAQVDDLSGLRTDLTQSGEAKDRQGFPTDITITVRAPVNFERGDPQTILLEGFSGLADSVEYDGINQSNQRGFHRLAVTLEDRAGNRIEEHDEYDLWVQTKAPEAKFAIRMGASGYAMEADETQLSPARFIFTSADIEEGWQDSRDDANRLQLLGKSATGPRLWLLKTPKAVPPDSSVSVDVILRDRAGGISESVSITVSRQVLHEDLGQSFSEGPMAWFAQETYYDFETPLFRDAGPTPTDEFMWSIPDNNRYPVALGTNRGNVEGKFTMTKSGEIPYDPEYPEYGGMSVYKVTGVTVAGNRGYVEHTHLNVSPLDVGDGAQRRFAPAVINIPPTWKQNPPNVPIRIRDQGIVPVRQLGQLEGTITLAGIKTPSQSDGIFDLTQGADTNSITAEIDLRRTINDPDAGPIVPGQPIPQIPGAQPGFNAVEYVVSASESSGGNYVQSTPYTGNAAYRWMNLIRLSPDVVATGTATTIRIEAGFLTDEVGLSDFQANSGDYVNFYAGGTNVTEKRSDYETHKNDPVRPKNKISIVGQRLTAVGKTNAPHNSVQALELDLLIGSEVAAGLLTADVKFGAVKAYTDDLSQAYSGANEAHRMSEALAVVKSEFVTVNEAGEQYVAQRIQSSIVKPKVVLSGISQGDIVIDQENKTATVTIAGQITDELAQIVRNGAGDLHKVSIYVDGTLWGTKDISKTSDPATLMRPYAHHYHFSEPVVVQLGQREINLVEIVTDANASGRTGRAAVMIPVRRNYSQSPAGGNINVATVMVSLVTGLRPDSIDSVLGVVQLPNESPTEFLGVETAANTGVFVSEVLDEDGALVSAARIEIDPSQALSIDSVDVVSSVLMGYSRANGAFVVSGDLVETSSGSATFTSQISLGSSGADDSSEFSFDLLEPKVINERSETGSVHPYALRIEHPFEADPQIKIGTFSYSLTLDSDGKKYISGSPIKVFVATAMDGNQVLIGLENDIKVGDEVKVIINGADSPVKVNSVELLTVIPDRGMSNTKQDVGLKITNYKWPAGSKFRIGGVSADPDCEVTPSGITVHGEFLLPASGIDENKIVDLEVTAGGATSTYKKVFHLSNPNDTKIWGGTIRGSVIPYLLGKNFAEVAEWASLNFYSKSAYWNHPLEWDEVSILESAGLVVASSDSLSQEDRDRADKFLPHIPGSERYTNWARIVSRGRVIKVFQIGISSNALLSWYRLARDLNPLHFAAERGWQIGSGEEMFTEIKHSRTGAAVELVLACVLIKGVNVALSRAKAMALEPVFRGTYVPQLQRLNIHGPPPPLTPASPSVRPLNAKTVRELENGDYIFARNATGQHAVLLDGPFVRHFHVFGSASPYTGAGTLTIQNGRIVAIGNQSGGYRPSAQNFMDNVLHMRSKGIPMEVPPGKVRIIVDWE